MIAAVLAALVLAALAAGIMLGYWWAQFDPPRAKHRPTSIIEPWKDAPAHNTADDADRWLAQLTAEEPERLATAGERTTTADLLHPGGLADTGELRALAYSGDTDALAADTNQYLRNLEN